MNRSLPIALIAVIAIVVVASVALGTNQEGSDDGPSLSQVDGDVFTGPFVNNINMGRLVPVDDSLDQADSEDQVVVYRAEAREGFQFIHWTDRDGNHLTDNPCMEFNIHSDKGAVAVFEQGGLRSVEIEWYPVVFGPDGVSSATEPERINVTISSFDWYDSVNDPSTVRGGTIAAPTPVSMLTDDGVVAEIVEQLNGFISEAYPTELTNLQTAMVVLAFVQDAIGYETDWNLYDREEFWAAPMESLFLGYGDCEDGAILFVSIASAMGVDCGFVTFDSDIYGTEGTGHMSVAIALEDDEHITGENVATFTIDGVTYAYGETSVDPALIGNIHPMFGILGESYSIMSAKWTHVDYTDGVFTAGSTLSIGGRGMPAGHVIYGDDYSHPPAVTMSVGDGFSYTPGTTLPAEFAVSGDGLAVNGGFLVWDASSGTLSGTADEPGTYSILITATSTVGPEQVTYQTVTLIVEGSAAGAGSSDHYLIYGDGGFRVESTPSGSGDDSDDRTMLYIVVALAVIAGVIIAWRVI